MRMEPLVSEATALPTGPQTLLLYVCIYECKYDLQTISNISEGFLTRHQTRVPQMTCLNTRPHSSSSLFCNIVGAIHNDNFSYKGLTWLSAASVSLLSMSCTIHLSWLQFPAGTAIMKTTMVNLNWLKKASKNTAVWFSGGAESTRASLAGLRSGVTALPYA